MIARSIAGAGLVVHSLPALAPVVPLVADALAIPRRIEGSRDAYLTFDDGPHPEGTPAVLESLAQAGASATFFLVGEQVEQRSQLAAEIAAAGHRIAIHCHRHRSHLRLAPWQVFDDLDKAQDCIGAATGVDSALYRPPYGIFSGESLVHVRRRGWQPLLWSSWGRDWRADITPERIAELALRGVGRGSVILLHDADHYSAPDSWRRTVAALPRILDRLGERNLRSVALPEAL